MATMMELPERTAVIEAPSREVVPVRERVRPPVTDTGASEAKPLAGSNMAVYLPWVDLLRFVACVLVIYSHASVEAHLRVAFGHAGVALFFSISGYLIGSVLKNMYGQANWYAKFYVNRFLRIYPPLLAGLAFFGILAACGFANKPGTLEVFLRNVPYEITFTEPLSPDKGVWLPYGIVWTLCIEEWFYLLLPLIFAVVGPKRALFVLIGLMVLTAEPRLEKIPGTDYGMWFFWPCNLLGGAVLALSNVPKRTGFPWVGIAGLILLVVNAALEWCHPFGPVMGLVTTTTVWSFATTTTAYPKMLNWALFAGKRSYGIYLLHITAVSAAMRVAQKAVGGTSGLVYDVIAVTLAVAMSVAAAAVLWRLYEEPILNFRKRVKTYPGVFWGLLIVQLGLVPAGIAYWLVMTRL
ncbi:MAG TPA: acyltransferase [Gemmataceae bacterium]|jgi:peptidoglycan/LPS O-acetylase OafA/YrhL|nr:acyltransferase [Gemmataceae bacterium]